MLFPSIVGRYGVWTSLGITALAVGVIWLMCFAIGHFIEWAVSEELKRRSRAADDGESRKVRAAPGDTDERATGRTKENGERTS